MEVAGRDPFYAGRQFAIGLHEFLNRLPGLGKWNEQADREQCLMPRFHELAEAAEVAFGA
jgi:hypothetical protein